MNITIDDPVLDVPQVPGQEPFSNISIDDPLVAEDGQLIPSEPTDERTRELLRLLDYYENDPEGKEQVKFENRRAYTATRIPILNLGVAAEGIEAYRAAKRLEANQYDESYESQFQFNDDTARIARFFVRQERLAEEQKDKTWGRKVFDLVSGFPGLAAEFAATGGIYSLARRGARRMVIKSIGQSARRGAGKMLTNTAGVAVGAAAQATMMPHRLAEAVANQMSEGIDLKLTADEQNRLKLLVENRDDSFAELLA